MQLTSKLIEDLLKFIDGKVKSQSQMADFMGLNLRTYQRYLKLNGYKAYHKLYSPKEQLSIFVLLGWIDEETAENIWHSLS